MYALAVRSGYLWERPSSLYLRRFVMSAGDEIVRVEMFKIEQFMALGLGRYQAIRAVEDSVDWRAVETPPEDGLHALRRARNLALSRERLDSPECLRPVRDRIGSLFVFVDGRSRYPNRVVGDHRGDLRENLDDPQHPLVEGEGVARAPVGIV